MARVTIQDCLEQIPNRFKLLMIASKRAHQLANGSANPQVEWDNDKPTVVALREIAAGFITKKSDLEITGHEEASLDQLSPGDAADTIVDVQVTEIETQASMMDASASHQTQEAPSPQEDHTAADDDTPASSQQNMKPDA